MLLRARGYLLLLCAQLQVEEHITIMMVVKPNSWKRHIKYLQLGFPIPAVISNKGTHHNATNLIHLHIPLRLALRYIFSAHVKNKQNGKPPLVFYQIYFSVIEKKYKVGEKGCTQKWSIYSKLNTIDSHHHCEEWLSIICPLISSILEWNKSLGRRSG